MPIGDWIREANERRRQKLWQEGYDLGYSVGYIRGYADALAGRPRRNPDDLKRKYAPPDDESGKSA